MRLACLAMPKAPKPVDALLAQLREALKAELREEVRAELIAELSGSKSARRPIKKTSGPKPKAAAPSNAALKVKKGVRRTEEDVAAAADVLLAWFKANPGSRIDQASVALKTAVKDLQLPLSKLKEGKKVKTAGKLRGTTYSVKG